MKITPRDRQVLELLKDGNAPKQIGTILGISPRTVKQHLRLMYLRAGIPEGKQGKKLVSLINHLYGSQINPEKLQRLEPRQAKHAELVCSGLSDKEITAELKLTSTQDCKNRLRLIYDTLGVSSRLELRVMLMPAEQEVRAFDGKKYVTDIILADLAGHGPVNL